MKNAVLAAGCFALLMGIGVPLGAFAGDAKKGKPLFEDNCSACHNSDSTEVKVGPGLKGLFKRAKLASGKAVSEANVLDTINKGGDTMPPFADALKPAEKDDIIAFLKTL